MDSKRHHYENLDIYNRSLSLAVQVMKFIDLIKPFKLAEQISSAAVSIPSNIAEGAERGTDKEFRRFLEYSSGSAAELITQLKVIQLSNRIPNIELESIINKTKEINAMIRGLIIRLKNKR